MSLLTYLDPNAIKDASIEGIKIKNGAISSSKIDETVASKSYVDALEARATNAVQITYADLKSLRDAGKLVPGTQYRITDYTCTTTQANTKSAGHQFDIIVTADDESTLNEEARAALHTGDEYFSGCTLSAWKIWYCLDNDTTRFAWADSANGKGVIYRMIDEWNNDVPYDFKNIICLVTPSFIYFQWGNTYLFRRDASIDISIDGIQYYGYISESKPPAWSENKCWIKEESLITSSKLYKSDGSEISYGQIQSINLDNYETYTFGRETDLSKSGNCYNNIILPYYESNTLTLNKIIFGYGCCDNTFGSSCRSNSFGNSCSNNTFGPGCYGNTFGNNCSKNSFDPGCYSNTFETDCSKNSFGPGCYDNTFETDCSENSFGPGCYDNTFGTDCSKNSFGPYCHRNTFGNYCYGNLFGPYCQDNRFRYGCSENSFGPRCTSSSFGDYCYNNTFGSFCNGILCGTYCSYNSFGSLCDHIIFASDEDSTTKYDYYHSNHVGDGCRYIIFTGTETASEQQQVQNYNFAQGLKGTSSAYLTIDGKRNLAYETKVAKNSNGEIKTYCEADLIL